MKPAVISLGFDLFALAVCPYAPSSLVLLRNIHNLCCQDHGLWCIVHLVHLLLGRFFLSLVVQHGLVGEDEVVIIVITSVNLGDSFSYQELWSPHAQQILCNIA